jgi:hypothetical protein
VWLSEEPAAASSYHEDGGRIFHRKIGKFRPVDTASHPIRQHNSTLVMITRQLKFSGNQSLWKIPGWRLSMWDLKVSRRCCWRLKSYEMWHCVRVQFVRRHTYSYEILRKTMVEFMDIMAFRIDHYRVVPQTCGSDSQFILLFLIMIHLYRIIKIIE